MTQSLLIEKTRAAIAASQGDWPQASRLLAEWAETDHALLLALSAPYLRAAAAHVVQKTAEKDKDAAVSPVKALTSKPAPSFDGAPARKITATALTDQLWDQIIEGVQATNGDMDAEQHSKALRTIAKAFMAKRLDQMAENRKLYQGYRKTPQ